MNPDLSTRHVAAMDRDQSVFINCPFDGAYGKSLDAIIFAIVCCGLEPRSALESDATSEPRLARIVHALRGSLLSVHDLSRIYADPTTGVARLNMPLELGIAMAMSLSYSHKETQRAHHWTALVEAKSAYNDAISDLAGHDLKRYDSRETLVARVVAWLHMRVTSRRIQAKPNEVMEALPEFDRELARLRKEWADDPLWIYVVECGQLVAARHGLGRPPAQAERAA